MAALPTLQKESFNILRYNWSLFATVFGQIWIENEKSALNGIR